MRRRHRQPFQCLFCTQHTVQFTVSTLLLTPYTRSDQFVVMCILPFVTILLLLYTYAYFALDSMVVTKTHCNTTHSLTRKLISLRHWVLQKHNKRTFFLGLPPGAARASLSSNVTKHHQFVVKNSCEWWNDNQKEKPRLLGEKPVQVPPCPPQIRNRYSHVGFVTNKVTEGHVCLSSSSEFSSYHPFAKPTHSYFIHLQ